MLGIVVSATPVLAAETTVPRPDSAPIDAKIQAWVDKDYYPGAALLVAQDNRVLHEKYFGAYKPDTVVYIASAVQGGMDKKKS